MKLTAREGAIISLYTDRLVGNIESVHALAHEHFPGIYTTGIMMLAEELRERVADDYRALLLRAIEEAKSDSDGYVVAKQLLSMTRMTREEALALNERIEVTS